MPARRRTDPAAGRLALATWRDDPTDRRAVTTAVRFTLEELADVAPGHTVEVRVPPAGAVQAVEDPQTWLGLVTGAVAWADAVADGRVRASGERSDISFLLPLQAARPR